MKQFIYLDNDIINSIIAQKDNGLTKDMKTENTTKFNQTEQNVIDTETEGKVAGGLFKLVTAEAKLNLGAKLGKEKEVSSLIFEWINDFR